MPSGVFPNLLVESNQRSAPFAGDGATWRDSTTTAPTALLATRNELDGISLPSNDAYAHLARRVGDPGLDRLRLTSGVEFWVGAASHARGTVNPTATVLLTAYLGAVATGIYPARHRDRSHARQLLASPDGVPPVCGDCVITGLTEQRPAALPDSFLDWVTTRPSSVVDAYAGQIAAAVSDRINAELAAHGVLRRISKVVLTPAHSPTSRIAS